jgi:hypothetical protein
MQDEKKLEAEEAAIARAEHALRVEIDAVFSAMSGEEDSHRQSLAQLQHT